MDSAARLITIILLASFATERLLACIAWFLDAARLEELDDDARRKARAERKRKLTLLTIGAGIAAAVVVFTGIRVLSQLGMDKTAPALDYAVTWLILFAGADRIRTLMGGAGESGGGSSPAQESPAIRIVVERDGQIQEISRAS
jgi:small-conductance mechanosensitive channel